MRHIVDHPHLCGKTTNGVQFLCPAENCYMLLKYVHEYTHIVQKHGLREALYDPEKDGTNELKSILEQTGKEKVNFLLLP